MKIEASGNQEESNTSEKIEGQDDISVYLTTSLDEEDLWVLLITKPRDGGDLSLKKVIELWKFTSSSFKKKSTSMLLKPSEQA